MLLRETILTDIQSGTLQPGARLASERSIASTYKLSRAKVREVLIELAAQGWITTKRGDGSRVRAPIVESVQQHAQNRAQTPIVMLDILEYRRALEPNIVYKAATTRTNKQWIKIHYWGTKHLEANLSITELIDADIAFHIAIAEATNNPVFVQNLQAMVFAMREPMQVATKRIIEDQHRNRLIQQHGEIITAIRDGDAPKAYTAMLEHLNSSINALT